MTGRPAAPRRTAKEPAEPTQHEGTGASAPPQEGARSEARAPSGTGALSLEEIIPEDAALEFDELPTDFWAHEPGADGPPPAARAANAAPQPGGGATSEPEPARSDRSERSAAGEGAELFDQLQRLFPGRVVEVRPHPEERELTEDEAVQAAETDEPVA